MDDLQKTLTSSRNKQGHIFNAVDAFVKKEHLLPPLGSAVVLACSGGPDSVFLAEYLSYKNAETQYKIVLAYVDHEWRAESKTEVQFCKNLAKKHTFLFETTTVKELEKRVEVNKNGSKEAYARELRYAFFNSLVKKHNAVSIFLGHHKDDQIETFFIRLIRGSSLTGLCAMRPQKGLLVRPLLCINKAEIINFLEENKIPYCIDHSNNDPQYLRNRIRNSLISTLESIDLRSTKNISIAMERLQNAEYCLERITEEIFEKITTKKNALISIDIQKLLDLQKELQYRVLLHFLIVNKVPVVYSERLFEEILRFLKNKKSNMHKISLCAMLKKEKNNLQIKIQIE